MKETARAVLNEIFNEWCDAIEAADKELIKIFYNQFTGACELYEKVFNENVYHRAQARQLVFEEA